MAGILIAFAWTVPLLFAAVTLGFDRCAENEDNICLCDDGKIPRNGDENCPFLSGCSNFWSSATHTIVLLEFVFWAVLIVFVGVMLAKANNDLKNMVRLRREKTIAASLEGQNNNKHKVKTSSSVKEEMEDDNAMDKSDSSSTDDLPGKRPIFSSKRMKKKKSLPTGGLLVESIHRNVTLLFFMFVAYVVGTSPYQISALLHSVSQTAQFFGTKDVSLIPIVLLPVVAEALCTIMIVLNLANVRSAVRVSLSKLC